jgi:hypothetical protein
MPLIASDTHETLSLPPGFSVVALRESGDAFAHACAKAAEEGAGTLVWVRRFDVAEFAVVLEPLEPLAQARKALFMAMNAVGDAISAHCPPERDVTFDWPGGVRFDGGLVGGTRIGWPEGCAEDAVPDWLVIGAIIRVTFAGLVEPGQVPSAAALDRPRRRRFRWARAGYAGGEFCPVFPAPGRYLAKQRLQADCDRLSRPPRQGAPGR